MADAAQDLQLLFHAAILVLLAAAALLLAFTGPASRPKRLLALVLGVGAASQGAPFIAASGIPAAAVVADHYWIDVAFLRNWALLAALAVYPSAAALRSWHGGVLLAGGAVWAAATALLVGARDLAFLDPAGFLGAGANRTPLFASLVAAGNLLLGLAVLSALARAVALPAGPARSAAFVVLACLGAGWLSRPGAVLGTLGAGVVAGAPLEAAAMAAAFPEGLDPFLATRALYLLFGAVAVVMALRHGSVAWLGFVGYGLLRFLLEGLPGASFNMFSLYYAFPALGVLHAARRHGAFALGAEPLPRRLLVDLAVFLTIVLAVLSAGLGTLGGGALPLAATILGALLLGFAAVAAVDPEVLPLPLRQAPGADRLAPYRAALAAEVEAGTRPEETSRKLHGLRRELGITTTEHALLDYALRAGGEAARPPAPGALFAGRYRVLRGLGPDGGGPAYLCADERAGRDVVVKLLPGPAAGDRAGELLREARALAAVRHPRVVALHDVESVGDQGFLVMEHAEGGSLAARLASGPLDRVAWRSLAGDILEGLAAAHAAGVVHRDVKPSNVLLDRDGRAKLGDFGVARLPGLETTAGWGGPRDRAVGTVRYMSPEQARGRPAEASSDLYSAAAVLHEAWTGAPLVQARPGESPWEVQMRIAAGHPLPRALPGPPRLRAWFRRALDPDPARRFPTAAAMRAALDEALGQAGAAASGARVEPGRSGGPAPPGSEGSQGPQA